MKIKKIIMANNEVRVILDEMPDSTICFEDLSEINSKEDFKAKIKIRMEEAEKKKEIEEKYNSLNLKTLEGEEI